MCHFVPKNGFYKSETILQKYAHGLGNYEISQQLFRDCVLREWSKNGGIALSTLCI